MSFTSILRCADHTLYVGHTEDLATREQTHNDGRGAKYTAARRPVRMVYAEEHASVQSAIAREHQLKQWSHRKKEALIFDDRAALRSLGRRATKLNAVVTWRDLLNGGLDWSPGNAGARALCRQVLPQEPQCMAQDVARRTAVVEEIEGMRAFGMVDESNREVLFQSLTDEAVD